MSIATSNLLGHEFRTAELKELGALALTHSSCGPRNNSNLARVGEQAAKAAASEYLFKSDPRGRLSGVDYQNVLLQFTVANLAEIATKYGLAGSLRMGNGTTAVSPAMLAQGLNALFGAISLGAGREELTKVLVRLGIIGDRA